jgi:Reverse transcriptase (RNA-dependent DNA polymerase)
VPGERFLLDISFIKKIRLGKQNIWTLIEDQFSKMKWSIFTRRRGDMLNKVVEFIRKLKANDPKKGNINKSTIPSNKKLIGSKWVFKEEWDGVFRARLVALGYSQGNYSSVVNDSSFRIRILLIAKLGLKAWSLDVKTTFLNGDLKEQIYMKLPQGFNGEDPDLR